MSQRARPRSPAAFERSGGRADLLDVRTASEYSAEQLHLFFQGVELERVLDRQKSPARFHALVIRFSMAVTTGYWSQLRWWV